MCVLNSMQRYGLDSVRYLPVLIWFNVRFIIFQFSFSVINRFMSSAMSRTKVITSSGDYCNLKMFDNDFDRS